ncbi:hypothetical protein CHISP_0253 [Chitinispirillum alkaliphilum]|nr:hypothetical protein CHISP_0253 [Chitinispirillum alkaliphilum]
MSTKTQLNISSSLVNGGKIMAKYGIVQYFEVSFDVILSGLIKELQKKGFDILSSCKINKAFRETLGVKYGRYLILSVANLPLAYKALKKEEHFGLVLPCNIAVFEKEGKTVISTINPSSFMHIIDNEHLNEGAAIIEKKFREILDTLKRNEKKIAKEQLRTRQPKLHKAVA